MKLRKRKTSLCQNTKSALWWNSNSELKTRKVSNENIKKKIVKTVENCEAFFKEKNEKSVRKSSIKIWWDTKKYTACYKDDSFMITAKSFMFVFLRFAMPMSKIEIRRKQKKSQERNSITYENSDSFLSTFSTAKTFNLILSYCYAWVQ